MICAFYREKPPLDETWDFSSLSIDTIDTVFFLNPASTPYSDSFPSANLALLDELEGMFIYLISSSSSVQVLGAAGLDSGKVFVATFNPPDTKIKFPSTYLTSFTGNSDMERKFYMGDTIYPGPPKVITMDSLYVKNSVVKYDTMDGWGTVITPLGSYSALRQKTIECHSDSIWGYVSDSFPPFFIKGWNLLNGMKDTTVFYSWFANGMGFTVVEMEMDSLGNTNSVSFSFKSPPVGIPENQLSVTGLAVYPNPASEELTFVIEGILPEGCTIEIINCLGQTEVQKDIKVEMKDMKMKIV